MTRARISFFALACFFASPASAAVGPVADLVVSNADVSPDGFTRGAIVVGNNTIGPLIVGNKVCLSVSTPFFEGNPDPEPSER